jgi:hypothetical protein
MSSKSLPRVGSASVLASMCAAAVADTRRKPLPPGTAPSRFRSGSQPSGGASSCGFPFNPSTESSLEVVS